MPTENQYSRQGSPPYFSNFVVLTMGSTSECHCGGFTRLRLGACLLPADPHFVSKLPLCDSPLRGDFEQTRSPCPIEFLPREIPEGYFTGARSNRDYPTGVTPMPAAAPPEVYLPMTGTADKPA
jgi:hypothetical protein